MIRSRSPRRREPAHDDVRHEDVRYKAQRLLFSRGNLVRPRAFLFLCCSGLILLFLLIRSFSTPAPATLDVLITSPAFDRVEPKIMRPEPDSPHTIYFITPTYYRPTQMVDLVRLSQTLSLSLRKDSRELYKIYWILVEDAAFCTSRVRHLLNRSGLPFAHLATRVPPEIRDSGHRYSKGVAQRNAALELIITRDFNEGVVYFGDDDNAYDLRLFSELARVRSVGVLPVAYAGGGLVEGCEVDKDSGRITAWRSNYRHERKFPIDMASFGFRVSVLREKAPRFRYDWGHGQLVTKFMEQLVTDVDKLEPLAVNCTEIYVYYVRTVVDRQNFQVHDPLRYRDIAAQV